MNTPIANGAAPEALPSARDAGKAARKQAPRSAIGEWNPDGRGHDALETILAQNAIRDAALLPIRHGRMAASPWSYYRGAAAVMAADLASAPHTDLQVQLCGDAHVLNFGLWRSPERNLLFDLRDFDETLPGPFEWDVKRFLASLVILADSNGLPPSAAREAVRRGFDSYRAWTGTYATWAELDVWYDNVDVTQLAEYLAPDHEHELELQIEKRADKRSQRGSLKKLTQLVDGSRQITEDPPYRTHAVADYATQLDAIISRYRASIPDHIAHLWSRYDLVDAVQQVVGVGSVGMRVFLTLSEERRTGDALFLQVKQAGPSVYEQFVGASRYPTHGERVVQGQRLIQASTDMFVGWTSIEGMDYYVRQFRDGKVIPDGAAIAPRLPAFAEACGHVLARAHARSGDALAIDGYLGAAPRVADGFTDFAFAYAEQNRRDHAQLAAAVESGTVPAAPGWP
ncbi:DUF2252 domain-containing protein [Tsukamurella paurometabola]|uniref:Uncharacterized protein conserved in bacteria n=1 Tax=Tsukamurella paurometabola TaxID=2061 RepID=A0A3P8K870_TSUPA|nr:DUF2252 domain-containing protein [Tsukamurella paurometabola]UEA83808.1 DUF2252 domain-containing protein [Tsukamurella paurometabola]VDR40954.1 Uncharacterized protein conserved in bacteria [Tsukamurella paurometabola]